MSSGREEAKDSEQHEGMMAVHSLNLLLKSIGATLTDVQDVVFKYVQIYKMLKCPFYIYIKIV